MIDDWQMVSNRANKIPSSKGHHPYLESNGSYRNRGNAYPWYKKLTSHQIAKLDDKKNWTLNPKAKFVSSCLHNKWIHCQSDNTTISSWTILPLNIIVSNGFERWKRKQYQISLVVSTQHSSYFETVVFLYVTPWENYTNSHLVIWT